MDSSFSGNLASASTNLWWFKNGIGKGDDFGHPFVIALSPLWVRLDEWTCGDVRSFFTHPATHHPKTTPTVRALFGMEKAQAQAPLCLWGVHKVLDLGGISLLGASLNSPGRPDLWECFSLFGSVQGERNQR